MLWRKNLDIGERRETDWGYCGSAPVKVKCTGGLLADPDPAVKDMAQRVRCRQETVNERFKNWGILNTPYRHNIFKHQAVFGAIVCLTQLSLQANPLFQVEYKESPCRIPSELQLSFNLKSKSYPYQPNFLLSD